MPSVGFHLDLTAFNVLAYGYDCERLLDLVYAMQQKKRCGCAGAAMSDFDQVLARIGMQIEEMKKRIRSSRDRVRHHAPDDYNRQDESTAERGEQTLPSGTENRPHEPVRKS